MAVGESDGADDGESWRSSRATTNYLLAVLVVTVAGFVSIGGGYVGPEIVAELLLALVLARALVLFLGASMRDETE